MALDHSPSAAADCESPIFPLPLATLHGIRPGNLLIQLLGEPDENSFGAPDVAEPVYVLILDHVADELRAAFAEADQRIRDSAVASDARY